MCRWGCETVDTTYMCKWCGTRYCRECLRGDFSGLMTEPTKCRKCNQPRCQGTRVEYVTPPKGAAGEKGAKTGGKTRSASRSASPSKKSAKSKTSAKKTKKSKGSKKKKKG